MQHPLVALTDCVLPSREPTRRVLSKLGVEMQIAEKPTAEAIVEVVRKTDPVLVTYAKITADMI